jgi:hypothetical protein
VIGDTLAAVAAAVTGFGSFVAAVQALAEIGRQTMKRGSDDR